MTQTAAASGALGSSKLDALLHSYGIASEYIEFSGNHAQISATSRLHMLHCMGEKVSTAADVENLLQKRQQARWGNLLPSLLTRAPEAGPIAVSVPASATAAPLRWQLQLESGEMLQGVAERSGLRESGRHEVGSEVRVELALPLPALPLGYHQLQVMLGASTASASLIVSPPACWQPNGYADGRRWWGLSCQLYTVRSADNWGIGDFADLLQLVELAAQQGASFVLLNPLHYLDLRYPDNASPYSPSDRRFLNPLYIALELCEDVLAPAVQSALEADALQAQLVRLRAHYHVDYRGVAALKLPQLAAMYAHFLQNDLGLGGERAQAFRSFCAEGGAALADFAELQSTLGIGEAPAFADPQFHCYLQWVAQTQLAACQHHARQSGMALGLVRDLAVGSSCDGAEVLGNPGLFCQEARIGAPPDNINPLGQNWGLPPILPQALIDSCCAHFIALVRSNMRYCGALRIDHVMSLLRLWWCPNDGSNANGAYVHYPVDALFAILRLESVRAQCVVIGEDLGVVPPEIRGYLDGGGLYSNCVFYFEKYDGWHFRKPEHYKEQALMMLANHDVAPLRAWWEASDLPLRRQLGLITSDEGLRRESEYRQGEKGMLLQWLAEQGLLPVAWQDRNVARELDRALLGALFSACGRTASRLLSLQLDDLCGVAAPVNVPGTSSEYPNWRRKLPLTLSELFATPDVLYWLQCLREARPA